MRERHDHQRADELMPRLLPVLALLVLSWCAPAYRCDGSPLGVSTIDHYEIVIYRATVARTDTVLIDGALYDQPVYDKRLRWVKVPAGVDGCAVLTLDDPRTGEVLGHYWEADVVTLDGQRSGVCP